MNFDKYNPLTKQVVMITDSSQQPLQHWMDSAPISLLYEYLKMHQGSGIYLKQSNGCPCLAFNPGMTSTDRGSERWTVSENAVSLFMDAADDLHELMRQGLLYLPITFTDESTKEESAITHSEEVVINDQPVQVGFALDIAGPSQAFQSTGVMESHSLTPFGIFGECKNARC